MRLKSAIHRAARYGKAALPRASQPEGYITSSDLSSTKHVKEPIFSSAGRSLRLPSRRCILISSEHYTELAENVIDLLNSFVPSASSTTTFRSTTTSAAMTIDTVNPISEAALGCSIFSSYMSLCAPTPSSDHPGSTPASGATDAALASCACYSGTYYVPNALDTAASAVYTSVYTSAPSSALVSLVTSVAQMDGFCASRNPSDYASAQFGQITPTASSSPSSPSDSTNVRNDGDRLGTAKMGLWAALYASVLLY